MVIVADRNGQLCNRLFHFSYFMANAIEYRYKVIYPHFEDYAKFFYATASNKFPGVEVMVKITPWPLLNKLILKFLNAQWLSKYLDCIDIRSNTDSDVYDLKQEKYQQLVHQKLVLTKGWMFRDEENLKKHRTKLKEIFTPLKLYTDQVEHIISSLKKKFDIIIGLHIRRGDYIDWNNGKYFYNDEVYAKKMKQMEQQLSRQGKSCCFFIASNELVEQASFNQFNTSIAQRHHIVDLYGLAASDYIIGPPSTFSYWAAFYGEKPLLALETTLTDVELDNFIYY